ncbi:MAG: shikimate kinase [Patescibacteria group bacterium]
MTKHVFIVGPGSVGKSTAGKRLAGRSGYRFIDVDLAFCHEVMPIGDYIQAHGYVAYCRENAALVRRLLERSEAPTVFPLPSGFLVHEEAPEMARDNHQTLRANGTIILLLPSRDPHETVDLIVRRHLSRGYLETSPEKERERFLARHPKYLAIDTDIRIFSTEAPGKIANEMYGELSRRSLVAGTASTGAPEA